MSMIEFRKADADDAELVCELLRIHAEFEKHGDTAAVTPELLRENFFAKDVGEIIFLLDDGKEKGLVLFYTNFSPFLGTASLVINNMIFYPDEREKGYGRALLAHVCHLAVERGCRRCEWTCSKWNTRAITFYLNHHARVLDDRDEYRIEGQALLDFAALDK